jgi:hypothetical protein
VGTPVTSAANPPIHTLITATVACAGTSVILGGGARVTVSFAGQDGRVSLRSSYPSSATQWTAVAVVGVGLGGGRTVTVTPYVLCSA